MMHMKRSLGKCFTSTPYVTIEGKLDWDEIFSDFSEFFFLNLLNFIYVQEHYIWLRSTTCKLHGTGFVLPGSAIVWFQIDKKGQRLKQEFCHTWNLAFCLVKCSVQLCEFTYINISDSLSGQLYRGRPSWIRPYAVPACVFFGALIIGCTLGWN